MENYDIHPNERLPVHFIKKENAIKFAKKHSERMEAKYVAIPATFTYQPGGKKEKVYMIKRVK